MGIQCPTAAKRENYPFLIGILSAQKSVNREHKHIKAPQDTLLKASQLSDLQQEQAKYIKNAHLQSDKPVCSCIFEQ